MGLLSRWMLFESLYTRHLPAPYSDVSFAGDLHCRGCVCHSLPPSGQHAVCCFLFTYVEEGYESNQYKVSEACSNLVIQAKSKCNIPSVTSPPWNRSLCGRWSKGRDGEGARKETGSGNVHFKYAVLLCLRSSSAWLKAVSYRVRNM